MRNDVLSVLSFKGQVEGDRRYITMSYRDGSTAQMLLKGLPRFNGSVLFVRFIGLTPKSKIRAFCGVGNMREK